MKKTTLLPALNTLVCTLNPAPCAGLWPVLVLLATLGFGTPPARAAVTEAWMQRYTNNGAARAVAVAVDGRGNVLVTGASTGSRGNIDYFTAKYAAIDGALLWEKRYDSAGYYPNSLALGPNGMVAVTGSPNSGFGGANAWATVVFRETLPPLSIELVPTGISLHFTGVPGHSYSIGRAPAVTGPWSTLATPIAPLDGLIDYVDTNAPMGAAFYRTTHP